MNLAVVHDMRLIHTDLKPENILFVSPEYAKVPDYSFYHARSQFLLLQFLEGGFHAITFQSTTSRSPKEGTYYKRLPKSSAIKIIDFGSTAYEHQDHNYIVSTRHYRAPEVILGMLMF